MAVIPPIKKQEQARVPYNHHFKSENKPNKAVAKAAEPLNPDQLEAK